MKISEDFLINVIFWIGLIVLFYIQPFLLLLFGLLIVYALFHLLAEKFGWTESLEAPKKKPKTYQEQSDFDLFDDSPLKKQGDEYEKVIGKKFEEKGDLVIYNGFIRGYEDGGVDVVAISPFSKTINLIQCKNWANKKMELDHIKEIDRKLKNHNFDFLNLSASRIKKYLQHDKDENNILKILEEIKKERQSYTIRRTLYAASEKVIDLSIGKHLQMIKPNIFRYDDLKIVFYKQETVILEL